MVLIILYLLVCVVLERKGKYGYLMNARNFEKSVLRTKMLHEETSPRRSGNAQSLAGNTIIHHTPFISLVCVRQIPMPPGQRVNNSAQAHMTVQDATVLARRLPAPPSSSSACSS